MAVSIRDVAKAANVSVSTVSRALNGYSDVSEGTRQLIYDTAQKLGYAPNQSAKNLSSKSQKNMAILASGMVDESRLEEFTGSILKGVYAHINGTGKTVAMYGIDSEFQKEKTLKDFCHQYSLAGVMLMGLKLQDEYVKQVSNLGLPCVGVDILLDGDQTASVNTDDVAAFEEITDYVLDNNHRKLVLVSGRESAQVTYFRYRGFVNSLKKHGINIEDENITRLQCDYYAEQAYEQAKKYIQEYKTSKATAFVCMSDLMALGVCRAIIDCGYRIPDDFSVTGFDGVDALNYIRPGITTIDQNVIKKGQEGIKLLSEMLMGKEVPKEVYVPHKLIIRESVKKY